MYEVMRVCSLSVSLSCSVHFFFIITGCVLYTQCFVYLPVGQTEIVNIAYMKKDLLFSETLKAVAIEINFCYYLNFSV